MDGRDDGSAALSQSVQQSDQVQGSGGVETGGGLIQEQDAGVD